MFYKNITNVDSPIYEPYFVTIVANENPVIDKIFTNIDFKGDTFANDSTVYLDQQTYDRLNVWTEYQSGSVDLIDDIDHKSSLKKKFNRWRANFPRDSKNSRERIRNTWAFVKLAREGRNTNRSELHDILVYYYS
jgi:hypothetical protein